MFIFNSVSQIPQHVGNACCLFIDKGSELKQKITLLANQTIETVCETELWQNNAKPFIDRNITPLSHNDYKFIGGSIATTLLVIAVAVKIFSIGALPIAAGIGALLLAGASSIIKMRLENHFNAKAWHHLNNIRNIASTITREKHNFAPIIVLRNELKKPEFSHIHKDLSQIDTEINQFKEAIAKHQSGDIKDSRKCFILHIEGIQKLWAPHRNIPTILLPEENPPIATPQLISSEANDET